MNKNWFQSLLNSFRSRIARVSPLLRGPQITTFYPEATWPGSLVTIQGQGFSDDRDTNAVTIGGVAALVLEAEPNRLQVLVGGGTVSGPVELTIAGKSVTAQRPLTVMDWPDQGETGEDGPPRFFDGPQHGTPRANVSNQPVLVILSFPTDQQFPTPAAAQAQSATEQANFQAANQWWRSVSYDSTSWNFTFTNWLPLPRDRRFYVWQQEDITDARRWLLREAVHRAVLNGTRIYAAHLGFAMAIVDASTLSTLTELSRASLGNQGTGVVINGQYAYVTAGEAGLYVIDITISPHPIPGLPWSDPTIVTHIPTTAWLHGLDIAGSLLVTAAEDVGIIVYDIAAPTSPVQRGALSFGVNALATAVRVVGTRAFVIVNTVSPSSSVATLRVVDLATPTAPLQVASVPLAANGMSLDVEATLCAVATDGAGVQFFDVSGVAPVFRGAIKTAASAYGIDLRGTTAFVAGGSDGLRIVDVSNPSAPTEVGGLAVGSAYDVVTDGAGLAYVSVEAQQLTAVDVSTLSLPSKLDDLFLESSVFPTPSSPNIEWQRALINIAIDSQNLAKRHDALILEAIRQAQGAGFNPNTFEGIIVVLNGPFLRGQSWTSHGFMHNGDSLAFNAKKGIIYMATNAEIARIAHEIGHWLGMLDMYEERYANGTALLGTAAPWDLGGGGGDGLHLFTGLHIHDIMRFYNTGAPNVNVAQRTWSLGAPALNETFDITAHGAVQDTDPARIHILKLTVADGLEYYVEVRQKQSPAGGLTFDRTIPVTNPGDGTVLLTRVRPRASFVNSRERQIMLLGTLDVGQSWADAARRIEIIVESLIQSTPRVYRVRLRWNQPDVSDPTGKYDPWITPWVTGKWETVDIWVDSPRNQFGVFESFEPGKPSEARMNGDRPWVGRINRIGTRIRNSGVADATNLQVSFYVNSPPGIGDNGSWFTLGTKTIPSLAANATAVVSHDWVPAIGQHTCLRVEILPKTGSEINVGNNIAQENVFTFDSAGGSSHQPVIVETAVRSPFTVWKRVDLVADGLPEGWHAVVDHAWVWLPPMGSKIVHAVIWTDLNTPSGNDREIPPLAEVSIEGWTDLAHPYLPIGGILARVKATKRVRPRCEVDVRENQLIVRGCIEPGLAGIPITVEVTDARGRRRYVMLTTDESGCFDLGPEGGEAHGRATLSPGIYTVQVFITAGGEAAETQCDPVEIEVVGGGRTEP